MVAPDRPAGPIGGQLDRRQLPRELLAPVRPEAFPVRPRQLLGLPPGELLAGGPRGPKRGREPRRVSVVERAQFLHEDPVRPAVSRDVVGRDEEDVVLRRDGEEHRPGHRPAFEIEGAMGLVRDVPEQFLGSPPRGVHQDEAIAPVAHLGHQHAVHHSVRGPARIVPIRRGCPGIPERVDIQPRLDPPGRTSRCRRHSPGPARGGTRNPAGPGRPGSVGSRSHPFPLSRLSTHLVTEPVHQGELLPLARVACTITPATDAPRHAGCSNIGATMVSSNPRLVSGTA